MVSTIKNILSQKYFSKEDIVALLKTEGDSLQLLLDKALDIKRCYVGNYVFYRGLIEYSNVCGKNCFYCGLRAGNEKVARYTVSDEEVMEAVRFAYGKDFASIVIQSGENTNAINVHHITDLIKRIRQESNHTLEITLSLGEYEEEAYQEWFDAGAKRYLLRIESSNDNLYRKIHPDDSSHRFGDRFSALKTLQKIGYQTGTGVMIGLPFQTIEDLADDLIFMRDFNIDMCGMGPYIEHPDTPLWQFRDLLLSQRERFVLSLKMIAILRILMKDINIAATTAMQTLNPNGREKAIRAGANVVMPNLTPQKYRENYLIYENKPGTDKDAGETLFEFEKNIKDAGEIPGYGLSGTSKHFQSRN
ncbi:MAG: [FeFe] hydrogenase H-cluster radical SAM maturase HydE [Bacteroidales bacterium]|jgi:biotin synthase|nr:[FeFe] hydrogenase H-cluster radical SAM maturase HydE [Bacteroidales bacterium]